MGLAPLVASLSTSKGLYVPLVGSGVSTGAGILTGYQIMLDLLGKLALLEGDGAPEHLETWFANKYGEQPSYVGVLERLSHTPAERAQLLRAYIEPTDDERALGRKVPSRAHAGLARLAARGYVRLIITTNFDSLIEQALRTEGLDPLVVTRADDIDGLPPLSHLELCVVKVHGDYRDLRTLNTAEELAEYPPALAEFLRRVLSDYGLIVCGWSATYDRALVALACSVKPSKYGTYWARRGDLSAEAKQCVEARGAMVIPIADAETFLHEVSESVVALETTTRQSATGADITLSRLKSYLQAADKWIALEELVTSEISDAVGKTQGTRFGYSGETFNKANLAARAMEYEAAMLPLLRILVTGAYYGRSSADKLWLSVVQRLVPDTRTAMGSTGWIDLADYPALLCFYALGIASLAAQRADLVVKTLTGGKVLHAHQEGPWIWRLHPWFMQDPKWFRALPGLEHQRAAVSERVYQILKPLFAEIAIEDDTFDQLFDDWELLLALTFSDLRVRAGMGPRAPVGRFQWTHHDRGDAGVLKRFRRALDDGTWEFTKAGLLGGDNKHALALLDEIEKQQELTRYFPE